jgi:uncharacterized FlgJ-related protein
VEIAKLKSIKIKSKIFLNHLAPNKLHKSIKTKQEIGYLNTLEEYKKFNLLL